MTESYAEVNGIKICYETKGKGELLLLVHGFSDRKYLVLPSCDYLVWIRNAFLPSPHRIKTPRFF